MEKEYLLHKWLNGGVTDEELNLLKTSPEYASYIKIAEASSGLEAPVPDSDHNLKVISENRALKAKVRRLNPFSTLLKIAAVLAFIVAGYLYYNSLATTISTQIAEKQNFLLPDNSEVTLNANTTIVYNNGKWKSKRELKLLGEAYFKVTKGSTFSVNTPSGVVTVLGTQFNVLARNELFYINCYEGLVSVSFNDTLIQLPAGFRLKVESGRIVAHDINNRKSPSWTADESSFDNTLLTTVLQELERQYPITITAQFSNAKRRFTGSFTHSDLNLALKSICDPLHLAYTIEEESVTIYAQNNE
jgi:ferric-dicitrate binding protein FerR (iron transport regulator)